MTKLFFIDKYKFIESLKYFTVLFQMRTNYRKYIISLFLYKSKNITDFPKATVILKGARFITREKSTDIAHLSSFYERETTNLLLNLKPKIFIDVGSHIGRFSVLLARKGSSVVSIEPSRENYSALIKNIELNNLEKKIKAINIGCSDKNTYKILYFSEKNTGQTSLNLIKGAKKEKIEVKTLDNICKNLNLNEREISVIKIDIEGRELNSLKGAKRILKKGKPVIIVEITNKKNKILIENFLKKFGFVCKEILDSRNFIFVKSRDMRQS